MAIRPPRQSRPRKRPARQRDLLITSIASASIALFGLRFLAALFGVEPWTSAWQVLALPTGVVVEPLSRIPYLDHTIIARLTVADTVAFIVVATLALLALASLSLRQARPSGDRW